MLGGEGVNTPLIMFGPDQVPVAFCTMLIRLKVLLTHRLGTEPVRAAVRNKVALMEVVAVLIQAPVFT